MTAISKIDEIIPVEMDHAVTPADLLQMAVSKDADIEKLEKLMALQERWDAKEAEKLYITAMACFKSDCPVIEKTKQGHNSKYAGLSETIEVIKELMSRNGLSHSWRTDQQDGMIKVTCVVTHIGGHSDQTSMMAMADDSGKKNAIQAIGSTVSYLQRYTLTALLGIASSDQDDDADSAGVPELDLDAVLQLFESSISLAQLNTRARSAMGLEKTDKAKAQQVYLQRKSELSGGEK